MKKWLAVAVCAVMALSCVGLAACGDKKEKGGTTSGAAIAMPTVVSEPYVTAESAINAYVKDELFGGGYAVYEVAERNSLGEVKADTVGLSQAQQTNIAKIEKFSVQIQCTISQEKTTVTQPVYVATVGEKYCYLVTVPEAGDRATRSYLEHLFCYDAFKNVKMVEDTYFYDWDGSFSFSDRAISHITETGWYGSEETLADVNGIEEDKYESYFFKYNGVWMEVGRTLDGVDNWMIEEEGIEGGTLKELVTYLSNEFVFDESGMFVTEQLAYYPIAMRITKNGLITFADEIPTKETFPTTNKKTGMVITLEKGHITSMQTWAAEDWGFGSDGSYYYSEYTFSEYGKVTMHIPDEILAAAESGEIREH